MEMIEVTIIIAFAMAIVNLFKDKIPNPMVVPFISLALAVILNVANAALFGGDMLIAGREAFIVGGQIIGIFAAGSIVKKVASSEPLTTRKY